ncbi:MAG: LptF/LptG family permease [Planctomycetota bacterium]
MRLLDRYVGWNFARALFWAVLVFSASGVILDYFSRSQYFGDTQRVAGTFAEDYSTFHRIVMFYAAYLPFILKQVLPFIAVAAALLTVNKMLRDNEVIPVVAAGVSGRRLFLPLFVGGLLVSLGHLAFDEFLVPKLNRKQIALKRFFAADRKTGVTDLAHLRDGKGTVTRAGSYSFADQSLRDVEIHRPWTDAGFERWTAPRLEPDGEVWIAPQGATVHPADILSATRRLPAGTRIDFGVSADDVEALASKQGTSEIAFSQLKRLVDKFPDRRNLRVALYKQLTRPLSTFVMLLVGVPMLVGAGRRRFVGLGLTLGLCGGFYLLDIFFTSLGDRGDLPPLLAAMLPLALLFGMGVARLATLRT